MSWLILANNAEEYDVPLDEADLKLFVDDLDSDGFVIKEMI